MKFAVAYHLYWDTKVDNLFESILPLAQKYFENKTYSEEVNELIIGIRCTVLQSGVKKGKFNKKFSQLEFQVTIDYDYYMSLTTSKEKRECIAVCFLRDVILLIKCKPKGFVVYKLRDDLKIFFQNIGWIGEKFTMI